METRRSWGEGVFSGGRSIRGFRSTSRHQKTCTSNVCASLAYAYSFLSSSVIARSLFYLSLSLSVSPYLTLSHSISLHRSLSLSISLYLSLSLSISLNLSHLSHLSFSLSVYMKLVYHPNLASSSKHPHVLTRSVSVQLRALWLKRTV